MGSIDSMRSLALSSRALEDMQIKTVDSVRQVNAAMGGAVSGAIDNLQAVMDARVEGAHGALQKMKSSIGGAGGVMDKVIQLMFAYIPEGITVGAIVSTLIAAVGNTVQLGYLIEGAAQDYKNYAAAWGVSDDSEAGDDGVQLTEGASRLVDLRDAYMVRYQYNSDSLSDDHTNVGGLQGSLGTWRPI